ncbi:protodermal factor 1-like [Nymphaea colorata]|nr:protodermal factor 1-like [Nymphaea colorata]
MVGKRVTMSLVCFLLGVVVSHHMNVPALSTAEELLPDSVWDESECNGAPHHGHTGCGNPPGGSYGTPRSGGGGYYHSPPSGGQPGGGSLTPPSDGGGYYHSPPTYNPPATGGGSLTPPSDGGGYYHSPPTYNPPATGGGGSVPVLPPPTTPVDPNIGSPFFFGTCSWWKLHPAAIYGLFGGYIGSVAGVFGGICTPVFGHDLTLLQALANPRTDGFGALFREGTASFLNSMVNHHFPFTAEEVRTGFTTALISDAAAASQAALFQQANEGRLKLRL